MIVALVLGSALGYLTQYLQAHLSGNWNTLASSGVVWVVFAFILTGLLGLSAGWSALLGFLSLVGALAGYYVAQRFIGDATSSDSSMTVWLVAAIVGGPIFGIAGSWWNAGGTVRSSGTWLSTGGESLRSEARMWHLSRPVIGVALVSAVLLAEGIYFFWHVDGKHASGRIEILLALFAPINLAHTTRDRLTGLLLLIPLVLLGVAFSGLLDVAS